MDRKGKMMKKIEKIIPADFTDHERYLRNKINELVDAVNSLFKKIDSIDWESGKVYMKQTQEPESDGVEIDYREADKLHKRLEELKGKYAHVPCSKCGHAEKDPECEHEWRPIEADTYRCYKCNKWKEKPAKKYAQSDKESCTSRKDELADLESQEFYEICQRYRNTSYGNQDCVCIAFKEIKDYVRKWAVEVVEKVAGNEDYADEDALAFLIKARLKESK